MKRSRKWVVLLVTGLGWSATLDAQILGLGGGGGATGSIGTILNSSGGALSGDVLPGEALPVNIDPFGEVPAAAAQLNEPLVGLDHASSNQNYRIELADEPELIIKQHSLNPLIELGEDPSSTVPDASGGDLPVLDIPLSPGDPALR